MYEYSGNPRGYDRKLAADKFKTCPLCGALNATANIDCFVCSWHGTFDHDEESVSFALDHLVERCPELAYECEPVRPRESWWTRMQNGLSAWISWLLMTKS